MRGRYGSRPGQRDIRHYELANTLTRITRRQQHGITKLIAEPDRARAEAGRLRLEIEAQRCARRRHKGTNWPRFSRLPKLKIRASKRTSLMREKPRQTQVNG